jgi:hypothetical protein
MKRLIVQLPVASQCVYPRVNCSIFCYMHLQQLGIWNPISLMLGSVYLSRIGLYIYLYLCVCVCVCMCMCVCVCVYIYVYIWRGVTLY